MARGRYISEFERDVIRLGVANGKNAPEIAEFIGRTKMVVYNQIKAMRAKGTLEVSQHEEQ